MKLFLLLLGSTLVFGQGRLRPPELLACPADHLTSFTGVVTAYSRGAELLRLMLTTDEGTTEEFTLRYRAGQDPARWFLYGGGPFKAARWKDIERSPGHLRVRTRATVWICDDGTQPILDWVPFIRAGSGN
jgi:hypothetical protein